MRACVRYHFYSNVIITADCKDKMKDKREEDTQYGDSDLLAMLDNTTQAFRKDQRDGEREIIKKMVELRHNMKYNKHLRSVYEKAKGIFDAMVDEQRAQIHSLDKIHRHLYELIRDERTRGNRNNKVIEMKKDMAHIGRLLKRMRQNLEYIMNIDTVVGVTIDDIGKIQTFDEVNQEHGDGDGDGDGYSDGYGEDPEVIDYSSSSDDEDSGDDGEDDSGDESEDDSDGDESEDDNDGDGEDDSGDESEDDDVRD